MTAKICYQDALSNPDNIIQTTPTAMNADLLFNGQTWNAPTWAVAGNETYIIETLLFVTQSIDYMAFVDHNLNVASEIKVEVEQGGVYNVAYVGPGYLVKSAGIIIFDAVATNVTGIKITVVIPVALDVKVLFCGRSLELPQGIEPSFTPPKFNRQTKRYPAKSQTGHYFGTRQEFLGWKAKISQKNVDPAWIETYWLDMIEVIETWPFFFAWDYESKPLDHVFCWLEDKQKPPYYSNPIHMAFDLSCAAIYEI